MRRLPDTPSQRWAAANNACRAGRRRLGAQSIGDFWKDTTTGRTAQGAQDLLWVLNKLTINRNNGFLPQEVYILGTVSRLTAKKVRDCAIQLKVTIPVELL